MPNTHLWPPPASPAVSTTIEAAQILRADLPRRAEQLAAPDAARCSECGDPLNYCGHGHA